jgi:hypothetical protein
MKRMLIAALAAAALAVSAAAGASDDEGFLVVAQWSCDAQARPSQREVAEWFGLANFDQVYDVRARTHRALQRACKRGVESVDIVMKTKDDGFAVGIAQR